MCQCLALNLAFSLTFLSYSFFLLWGVSASMPSTQMPSLNMPKKYGVKSLSCISSSMCYSLDSRIWTAFYENEWKISPLLFLRLLHFVRGNPVVILPGTRKRKTGSMSTPDFSWSEWDSGDTIYIRWRNVGKIELPRDRYIIDWIITSKWQNGRRS